MLNDTRIRNAKPAERDYKLTDFDALYILVRTNGSKLWRFAYRFEGKQKQLAVGAYTDVTLAEARGRRETARKVLGNGKDPSVERRLEKIAKAAGATVSGKSPRINSKLRAPSYIRQLRSASRLRAI